MNIKKFLPLLMAHLLFACVFLALAPRLDFLSSLNRHIYDNLVRLRYKFSAGPSPAAADVLLVTIDNRALSRITQRWPYERGLFARAIENLRKAGARVIAFDFAFFGKSTAADDAMLKGAVGNDGKVILAATIDEESHIIASGLAGSIEGATWGFVTKLKDKDGIVRRGLIYLVSEKDPKTGFLSWGMQILKITKGVDSATLKYTGRQIVFDAAGGKKLAIPVAPGTKSFLINFRYHTKDFKNISFYDAVNGDFDSRLARDKIVLIGMTSSILADVHNTALGWLPGLTLNANAFLTLYARDFLKKVPRFIQAIFIVCGIMVAAAFILFLKPTQARIAVFTEILAFFVLSFFMLGENFVHNYALFPIAVLSCLFLKKMLDITEKMWFNITKQRS